MPVTGRPVCWVHLNEQFTCLCPCVSLYHVFLSTMFELLFLHVHLSDVSLLPSLALRGRRGLSLSVSFHVSLSHASLSHVSLYHACAGGYGV